MERRLSNKGLTLSQLLIIQYSAVKELSIYAEEESECYLSLQKYYSFWRCAWYVEWFVTLFYTLVRYVRILVILTLIVVNIHDKILFILVCYWGVLYILRAYSIVISQYGWGDERSYKPLSVVYSDMMWPCDITYLYKYLTFI